MTATFRCLLSGQTVTFVHQVDIDSMANHPDYEPVVEEASKITPEMEVSLVKKAGRPSKKVEAITPEVE